MVQAIQFSDIHGEGTVDTCVCGGAGKYGVGCGMGTR